MMPEYDVDVQRKSGYDTYEVVVIRDHQNTSQFLLPDGDWFPVTDEAGRKTRPLFIVSGRDMRAGLAVEVVKALLARMSNTGRKAVLHHIAEEYTK